MSPEKLHCALLKVHVSVLSNDMHDNACSSDITVPLARLRPMQLVSIDPTLDLCTRYHPLGQSRTKTVWNMMFVRGFTSTGNRTPYQLTLCPKPSISIWPQTPTCTFLNSDITTTCTFMLMLFCGIAHLHLYQVISG